MTEKPRKHRHFCSDERRTLRKSLLLFPVSRVEGNWSFFSSCGLQSATILVSTVRGCRRRCLDCVSFGLVRGPFLSGYDWPPSWENLVGKIHVHPQLWKTVRKDWLVGEKLLLPVTTGGFFGCRRRNNRRVFARGMNNLRLVPERLSTDGYL